MTIRYPPFIVVKLITYDELLNIMCVVVVRRFKTPASHTWRFETYQRQSTIVNFSELHMLSKIDHSYNINEM